MNTMSAGSFIKSRSFTAIIIVVGAVAVIASAFSIGMAFGFHKARNSYAWGENYHRTFAGPRDGFVKGIARDFDGREFMESGGAFGFVLSIDDTKLVISGKDGNERSVALLPDTIIRKFREDIAAGDISVNDAVVIVGDSDDSGVLQARLIRIMPTPPITPGGPLPTVVPQPR